MTLSQQVALLFIIAIPIACIAWTVTHEEVFRELREFCVKKSKTGRSIFQRKIFYLFTCEYCFSHYISLFFLIVCDYTLVFDDWRGYLIGFFALVWVANIYMSLFALVRVGMKEKKMEADIKEEELKEIKTEDKKANH